MFYENFKLFKPLNFKFCNDDINSCKLFLILCPPPYIYGLESKSHIFAYFCKTICIMYIRNFFNMFFNVLCEQIQFITFGLTNIAKNIIVQLSLAPSTNESLAPRGRGLWSSAPPGSVKSMVSRWFSGPKECGPPPWKVKKPPLKNSCVRPPPKLTKFTDS